MTDLTWFATHVNQRESELSGIARIDVPGIGHQDCSVGNPRRGKSESCDLAWHCDRFSRNDHDGFTGRKDVARSRFLYAARLTPRYAWHDDVSDVQVK